MLLLILACVAPTLHDVIDLTQQLWTLHGQDDDGGEINVPATVPGNVYSDLQAAGVLQGDFYYRFNDVEFRYLDLVEQMLFNYVTLSEKSMIMKLLQVGLLQELDL